MVGAYEAAQSEKNDPLNSLTNGNKYFRLRTADQARNLLAPVFIKCDDPATARELLSPESEITAAVGDIVSAWVPVSRIHSIAENPHVQSMQISATSTTLLNLSRVEARVDQVHQGNGLDRPYRGNGVVLGIVDSGIDWGHPDFGLAANNTRIQFLKDYANNGREWTKNEIDLGQCTELDGSGGRGHGTHVSGIAGGNGTRNAGYIGMAPESDIVFVKGLRDANSGGGFQDVDVVGGVQFIFNKAQAMNEPAVVNLSLGGQFGPHDGTSLYEQSIANLTGSGRIVVAAAGNDGADFIHASYSAQSGTGYADALETLWGIETGASITAVDMWYPAGGTVSVGLAAYAIGNYSSPRIVTNPVPLGQSIQSIVLSDGTTSYGRITIDARTTSDPNNNARNVLFVIDGDNGTYNISNYAWSIYTFVPSSGSATTLDMWVITGGAFVPVGGLPGYFRVGDNNKSIGIPATARNVISVGSYVSKTSWVDIDGIARTQPGAVLGQISTFSSMGPSRDGRVLPTLTAPGEAVISPLSRALVIGTDIPRAEVLQGGGLQKLQGTSMASPHVAGTTALLLERNKYLTPENVAQILSSSATHIGTFPNNTWGAGKLNALAAMQVTPPAVDCATLAKTTGIDCDGNRVASYKLLDAYPNPFNPATTIGFEIGRREHIDLAIYSVLGQKIRVLRSEDMDAGLHEVVWDGTNDLGRAVASGVYFARLSTPEYAAANRLILVK